MKLADFLSKAKTTGHHRYRLTGEARGTEIARGLLVDVDENDLEALARGDCAHLPRDTTNAYTLVAEDNDGAKVTRFTIRAPGGASPDDKEHRVDVASSGNMGAVVAHLTKLIVEQHKATMTLVGKVIDRQIAEDSELGKLRRQQAKRGDIEIQAQVSSAQTARDKERRAASAKRWDMVLGYLPPLVARLAPGAGAPVALAQFRQSITDDQLGKLGDILGAVRLAKLMTLESVEQVGELFLT